MAFLEQFSEQERDLIVSIPYRAGVWVSSVDDTGGAAADAEELEKLEEIIAEKARGMFESAFVHEVIAETFSRKGDWKRWAEQLDSLLADSTHAVELVSGKLSERDVDAYRANILNIGVSVAKAFREFDVDAPFFVKIGSNLRLLGEALMRVIKRDKSYDTASELNISLAEDIALTKLRGLTLAKKVRKLTEKSGSRSQRLIAKNLGID